MTNSPICRGPKCNREVDSLGLCTAHYGQQWRGAELTPVGNTPQERFWLKVNKKGGIPPLAPHLGECWIWTGSKTGHGYGNLTRNKVTLSAHATSYRDNVGEIPDGCEIDHLCFRRLCVRPSHLEAVPHKENFRRMDGVRVVRDKYQRFRSANAVSEPSDD